MKTAAGPRATRGSAAITLLLFAFVFIGIQTLGSSTARANDASPAPDCSGVFAGYGVCAGVGPDEDPTPEPEPPDTSEADREAARVQATAAVEAQLVAPGWRIWPNHTDNQVVELTTFLHITENWEPRSESATVGDQTVTVTATPTRSLWTLTESKTGAVAPVPPCNGPGTAWVNGLTSTDCGWTPHHSSDVTGAVEIFAQIEYTVSSDTGTSTFVTEPSETRSLCVAEVLTYGVNEVATSDNSCGGSHPGDNPDGSVPGAPVPEAEVAGQGGVPTKTLTCSAWGEAGGAIVGLKGDVGAGLEFIVQEFADGSKIVTLAGDAGANGGTGLAPVGAAVQAGDLTVGAYFEAGASVWGTVGGGAEYYVPPGKSLPTFLAELAVGTATAPVTGTLNFLIPGGDPIPDGPDASAVFVDGTVRVEAGSTAVAGIGVVAVGASAGASAEVNHAVKRFEDGRWANVVTYTGELDAQASAGAGLPFFDWDQAQAGVHAEGAVSIETIYASDGTELETIVTVSYGTDADLQGPGDADDALSITTQQWTYDLTDPAVKEAVGNLDSWARGSPAELLLEGELPPGLDELREFGETTGPVTQQVTDYDFVVAVDGGIGIAGVSGKIDVGCRVLS